MKFLCAKVREIWLSQPQNRQKVSDAGLKINEPYIGIEVSNAEPSSNEIKNINLALEKLFEENKKAFPVRLIDL